jgi:cation:H+ antiporter
VNRQGVVSYLFVLLATLPWVVLRLTAYAGHDAPHQHALAVSLLAGVAILGAAFLLSWAGEVAQLDISQALALAFLAFVAVLPEYSVDMYFSWKAGKDPAYLDFPVANMTGANRLLIGIGWPAVLLVHWIKTRQTQMDMGAERRIEMGYLLLATLYSFLLPIKGTLHLYDAVVFVAIFVGYMRAAGGAGHVEPELLGPAAMMAALGQRARRYGVGFAFLYAGAVIFLSAEPFAEALVATGGHYGINKFLLVQWVAPLASESPEFIVALLFAWKGFSGAGLGTLVSSKVNQWTLLVGLIPVVFSISLGAFAPLPLSLQQREELLLTSAQSLFAIAVMADLRMSWWEAGLLTGLFLVQFVFHGTSAHYWLALIYIGLTALLILSSAERRGNFFALIRRRARP